MTMTNTQNEPVEVTQADRDAAADMWAKMRGQLGFFSPPQEALDALANHLSSVVLA